MKILEAFFVLAVIFSQAPAFALSEIPSEPEMDGAEEPKKIADQIKDLSELIDIYYNQTITLKTSLASKGLRLTSPAHKLEPEDLQSITSLEDTRELIIKAFKVYKTEIDKLSENPEALEDVIALKFKYDLAVVKAFLPRYEAPKVGIISKILGSHSPQYAEEILSRERALNLFYAEFDVNEPTKDILNIDYRISEIVKAHNTITAKINSNREANIYQVYPKHPEVNNGVEEASLYQFMIKGENFEKLDLIRHLTVTNIAPDHFAITVSCASLFGI